MISIDSGLIVIFLIVWILLVVLTKIFFRPVREMMRKREEGIRNDREEGDRAAAEYEKTLKQIEEDIKAARSSAFAVRDKWEKAAQDEKERLLKDVSMECRNQVKKAREELDRQLEVLKTDLGEQSGNLAEIIQKRLLQ